MSHWTVIKQDDVYWVDEEMMWGPRWCVKSPTGVGWGNYSTHAEALAYADKRARTGEVVLPRAWAPRRLVAHNGHPGGHTSGYRIITNDPEYSSAVQMWGPWGNMHIYKDIRPLALALLAHAERMEDA